jgi:hypothetical protein
MPRDGSVATGQRSPERVVIGPTKIDGQVSRLVELPGGGGRVQTWDGTAWQPGGADVAELAKHPHASVELMDRLGIPESERGQPDRA